MTLTVEAINAATAHAGATQALAVGFLNGERDRWHQDERAEYVVTLRRRHAELLQERVALASVFRFIEVALVGTPLGFTRREDMLLGRLSAHRATEALLEWALAEAARSKGVPPYVTNHVSDIAMRVQAENRIAIRYLLDHPDAADRFGEGGATPPTQATMPAPDPDLNDVHFELLEAAEALGGTTNEAVIRRAGREPNNGDARRGMSTLRSFGLLDVENRPTPWGALQLERNRQRRNGGAH